MKTDSVTVKASYPLSFIPTSATIKSSPSQIAPTSPSPLPPLNSIYSLREALRTLKRGSLLYAILKEELTKQDYWKNLPRGNPIKAKQASDMEKARRNGTFSQTKQTYGNLENW